MRALEFVNVSNRAHRADRYVKFQSSCRSSVQSCGSGANHQIFVFTGKEQNPSQKAQFFLWLIQDKISVTTHSVTPNTNLSQRQIREVLTYLLWAGKQSNRAANSELPLCAHTTHAKMDIFGIDKTKRIDVISAGPRIAFCTYFDGSYLYHKFKL